MYIVYFWSYPNWLEFSGIAKQKFVLSRTDASPFLATPNFLIAATPDEEKKKRLLKFIYCGKENGVGNEGWFQHDLRSA